MKIKKIGIILVIIGALFLWYKGFIDPKMIGKRFFNAQVSKYTKYGSQDAAGKFNDMDLKVLSAIQKDKEKYDHLPEYKDFVRTYTKQRHDARSNKIIHNYNGADMIWYQGPNCKPRLFEEATIQLSLSRNKDYVSNPRMTIQFDMPFKVTDDRFKLMLPCVTDEQVDYDELAKKLDDAGFNKNKTVDISLKKCDLRFSHVKDIVSVYITF